MNIIIMIIAIVAGTVIEHAVPTSALAGFARPPILALIVAYYALNHSVPMLLAAALLGGLLSDCIGSLPPGVNPIAMAAVGAVLYYSRDYIFSGKTVTNIVFGAVIGVSVTTIVFSLLLFHARPPCSFELGMVFFKFIGTMVYGAVLFPLIYALMGRVELLTGAGIRDSFQNDNNSDN